MKTVKAGTQEKNFAIPGEPITHSEFDAHIKEAEKGHFTSWEQDKKEFNVWRKKLKK
jgi:hypothetical protein